MPSLTIRWAGRGLRFSGNADGTVLNGVRYFFVEDAAYFGPRRSYMAGAPENIPKQRYGRVLPGGD